MTQRWCTLEEHWALSILGGQTVTTKQVITFQNCVQRDVSHWRSRKRVAALAAIGFFVAGYLAAYQFGLIRTVWEPLFGEGSVRVLHSWLSKMLPVPDAAVGATGYALEFVATLAGKADRWRAAPKLVLLYGAVVAALALAALILITVQVFILHAVCTLCLVSAAISLLTAWLASSEVLAAFAVLSER